MESIERMAYKCPYCHTALDPWLGWRAMTKGIQRAAPASGPAETRTAGAGGSAAEEIERLAALHANGHLTDEEFSALKRKLMT
jgi:hypothetical protein